jgi:hypothetical protein
MDSRSKQSVTRIVLVYEVIGFAAIIAIIWLDEIFDFPAIFLNVPPTPLNWQESLFESLIIFILGWAILHFTSRIMQRMKYLEGTLYVCASCKKIRDPDNLWHAMETFIDGKGDVRFSHGVCPECAEKLYPDFNPYKVMAAKKQEEKDENPADH